MTADPLMERQRILADLVGGKLQQSIRRAINRRIHEINFPHGLQAPFMLPYSIEEYRAEGSVAVGMEFPHWQASLLLTVSLKLGQTLPDRLRAFLAVDKDKLDEIPIGVELRMYRIGRGRHFSPAWLLTLITDSVVTTAKTMLGDLNKQVLTESIGSAVFRILQAHSKIEFVR